MLASERTFLSWTRTGLGFIALGVALEKVEAFAAISPTMLHLENSKTKVAAGVLVASGSACVAHGTFRYFSVMTALKEGIVCPYVGRTAHDNDVLNPTDACKECFDLTCLA